MKKLVYILLAAGFIAAATVGVKTVIESIEQYVEIISDHKVTSDYQW